jgi:hypothetical protein
MRPKILMESFKSSSKTCKNKLYKLKTLFLSFMVSFQKAKIYNMLAMTLTKPLLQGLGVSHLVCWQGKNQCWMDI